MECTQDKDDGICKHCAQPIKIRNPSGYCDHLRYPYNCETCKLRYGLKKYYFKKDVILYHPHVIVVPKGTFLYSDSTPIIGKDRLIFTDDKQIAEYVIEVK